MLLQKLKYKPADPAKKRWSINSLKSARKEPIYRMEFEPRAEILDIMETGCKQIHIRDVLNDEWIIAMFDSSQMGS